MTCYQEQCFREQEALKERIAALEAELSEQCRLNGMGSEREARLMARVEEMTKAFAKEYMAKDRDIERIREELAASQAREAEAEKRGMQWQPIETAPKTGRTILLGYVNSHGNWRTLRGQWFSEEAILDWEEPEDFEPGWYETSVEADDPPNCWWSEPTHWMPLPEPPIRQAAERRVE